MSNKTRVIKLTQRGGGIVMRIADPGSLVQMRMADLPGGAPGEKGVDLLSKTALTGMTAFLLGERQRLYAHRAPEVIKARITNDKTKNGPANALALFETAQQYWKNTLADESKAVELAKKLVESAKICLVREPFTTTFFERRDQGLKTVDSGAKISASWDDTIGTVQLLRPVLSQITGSDNPSVINAAFQNAMKAEQARESEGLPKLTIAPLSTAVPQTGIGKKLHEMTDSYKEAKPEFNDKGKQKSDVYLRPSALVVAFFGAIDLLAAQDHSFAKDLGESKYKGKPASSPSIFASPGNASAWMLPMLSKGRPNYIIRADFDIYLECIPEAIQLLLQGPQIAAWGEGGRVEWSIVEKEELPENLMDASIVASYERIRQGGPDKLALAPFGRLAKAPPAEKGEKKTKAPGKGKAA